MAKMIFQSPVRQVAWKKNSKSSQTGSRTYDLLVTSPNSTPLSYWRLVTAKANKLALCDKHCILLGLGLLAVTKISLDIERY